MRPSEVAMTLADLDLSIQKAIQTVVHSLTDNAKASTSNNAEAEGEMSLVKTLAELKITSALASMIKKQYDDNKKIADYTLDSMGKTSLVASGSEEILYSGNGFLFKKKRNTANKSASLKDFKLELEKAGIDKSVLDKAEESATREKDGAVYYIVDLI